MIEADLVDLGAELALTEARGEAAHDRVERLHLGDVGEHAVRIGARGEDLRSIEARHEARSGELIVQLIGREADGEPREVAEIETLRVGPVGLELGDRGLVALGLFVGRRGAGDRRGEKKESDQRRVGLHGDLHVSTPYAAVACADSCAE